MHSSGICVILVAIISIINAIPTSLVADLKSGNFVPKNKVHNRNIQEYVSDNGVLNTNNHIAIKRGGNNNMFHHDPSMSPRLSNFLYKNYHNADADLGSASSKSLKDYEKAYQYGSSNDRMQQDVQNAILKSDLYDMPSLPSSYYRYYDDNEQRNNRLTNNIYRNKRDTKLTPDEIIRLLSILENKFQHTPNTWNNFEESNSYYRPRYQENRQLQQQQQQLPSWYQQQYADSNLSDEDEDEDEQWLQEAVPYPHEVEMNDITSDYGYGYPRQDKRSLYGFANNYGSPFRQANNQKRYHNNDYYNYYISELMRSKAEPIRALKKRQAL